MHRTLVGDFQELRPCRRVERAFQLDRAFDAIDAPFARLAVAAVAGVDFFVPQVDADALERKLSCVRIRA